MSATIRRYIAERENFQFNRGLNETESAASKLRQAFLRKFVIGFDTNLYKTQEQRDWSYIAKRYNLAQQREYNYDVVLTGLGLATMMSNLVLSWRIYVRKTMVYWPIVLIPVAYYAIEPVLLQKHSKKLFDMCNLGEDYYLGQKRNQVLRECNRILDTEDF